MLHRLILKLRHRAYDSGRREVYTSPVPSVCVGNVTVGGTGKTPHTELLLRLLAQLSPELRLAVLSRGYGRKSKGYLDVDPCGKSSDYGDEPLQIARKFPEVRVAVDKDRVEGCGRLQQEGAELILLDDAFQYRRLSADLKIVLIDYNRPVFRDRLLPWGSLRDLPERIFEADVLIVSKCPSEMGDAAKEEFALRLKLTDYDPARCTARTPDGRELPLLFSHIGYLPAVPVFPDGEHRYVYSKQAVLLSGIAKDGALKRQVQCSYRLMKHFRFADHHEYTKRDAKKLLAASRAFPVAGFITTEKDGARLLRYEDFPAELRERLLMIPIEVEFSCPAERQLLCERLVSLLSRCGRSAE